MPFKIRHIICYYHVAERLLPCGEILRPPVGGVTQNIVIRNKEIGGIMCTIHEKKDVSYTLYHRFVYFIADHYVLRTLLVVLGSRLFTWYGKEVKNKNVNVLKSNLVYNKFYPTLLRNTVEKQQLASLIWNLSVWRKIVSHFISKLTIESINGIKKPKS
jgi:hypothetical protein